MKKFLSKLLLTLFLFSPVALAAANGPTDTVVNIAKTNQVLLTCYDPRDPTHLWGGQGVIYNVDLSGIWIVTAGHMVPSPSTECDAELSDGEVHTVYPSKIFKRSDLAIMFGRNAYWTTHASIKPAKIGEDVFAFHNVHIEGDFSNDNLRWVWDYTLTIGQALFEAPPLLMEQAPVPPNNLIFSNIFSQPGSSGGGVYDFDGNLVGIVSMGSEVNSFRCYFVNLEKAFEEELY